MKNISTQFQNVTWTDWQGKAQTVPATLQFVAKTFVYLQGKRHTADYDNHKQWTVIEMQTPLDATQLAFDNWLSVRTDSMAGNYLLAILLGKQRP